MKDFLLQLKQWLIPQKNADRATRRRQWTACAAVAVVAVGMLASALFAGILPGVARQSYARLDALYSRADTDKASGEVYPRDMLTSFTKLYDKNSDLRGYLRFSSSTEDDYLDIAAPVVQTEKTDAYKNRLFTGGWNPVGCLRFDKKLYLTEEIHNNKSLVVYGNSNREGQMLAPLLKLVGEERRAKYATRFSLDTLYETGDYLVFAVMLVDEKENKLWYFDGCETTFATNGTFLDYVCEIRARSLFNYPVDVAAGDRLAVLSTPAPKSVAKFSGARLVVVGRHLRSDEVITTRSTAGVTKNPDVVMPRAWYVSQNVTMHPYYTETDYSVDNYRTMGKE